MANTSNIQIISDGPKTTILKLTGNANTADFTSATLVDPAARSTVDPTGSNYLKAGWYTIEKIIHNIEDGIVVNLVWDDSSGTTVIEQLAGRGKADYRNLGGLPNPKNTGWTGKILWSTSTETGTWTSSGYSFSVILELTKGWTP